ncbi:uncharacterized protein JCM15063_004900 [Sporobolomyces koalae]|uniref:uncharacterized protein n=1 Tax=Sporobolomyces koalae TaxID=500713 RepID=UPI003173D53A
MTDDPSARTDPPTPPSPQLRAPWNYLHVLSQFVVLLALLPYHATVYSLFPKRRDRASWTLLDAVFLQAVRRYLAMMDTAGFKISPRDVFKEPGTLRNFMSGINFEWIEEEVEKDLVQGTIVDDPYVDMRNKVGLFSWYRKNRRSGTETEKNLEFAENQGELVGIFFHGGAFTHNTAHPKAQSTVMPQTIFNREKRFVSMHAVEFRLLPEYPFPSQLQDAVTVYVALLKRGIPAHQIILMGDSSGANIALSLARWVRDTIKLGRGQERPATSPHENPVTWRLADPGGLILFSPWVNPAHSFLDCKPEDYVRRSNDCDYIFEEGPFRHHLVHNLLGRQPRNLVLSPYLSPGRTGIEPHTFDDHPPCFVTYGTGERGQAECERLVEYLRRDGNHVEVVVTKDTPHDVLLLGFWKREQREEIWKGALQFLARLPKIERSSV